MQLQKLKLNARKGTFGSFYLWKEVKRLFNPLTRDDYNKVVEEFSDMIFRIAYQNLCNIADAEDVVQEVFISLLKSKSKIFNDSEHLKSWLIRVTINKCLDVRRSFFRKILCLLTHRWFHIQTKKKSLWTRLWNYLRTTEILSTCIIMRDIK